MRELLRQKPTLKAVMVIAHDNWRKSTIKETDDKHYEGSLFTLYELRTKILSPDYDLDNLKKDIAELRHSAHIQTETSAEFTFNLMLDIANSLENIVELSYYDSHDKAKVLRQRDALLDTIRYDANSAIANSIIQVGNLKNQAEG